MSLFEAIDNFVQTVLPLSMLSLLIFVHASGFCHSQRDVAGRAGTNERV